MNKSILCCIWILVLTIASLAQTEIKAVVKDANSYRELGDVNVYIKGEKIGTVTDAGGHFSLKIPSHFTENEIVFRHISYKTLQVSVDALKSLKEVFLEPRIIQLPGLEVVGKGETYKLRIKQDIPLNVALVEAKSFDIRGYIDAGDVLKTEQSIQVDEDLSGKKTISLRGGNPDDVTVLYNGIRINNPYDNIFDFSAIDLENLERFEIIKGSNTALYGPDAFSGVINIVPQFESNHFLRAQYRMGTYDANNIGLHLYQNLKTLSATVSYKKSRSERFFEESLEADNNLVNEGDHLSANLMWYLGAEKENRISMMFIQSDQRYNNFRDDENLADKNTVTAISYHGQKGWSKNFDLDYSIHNLDESQQFSLMQNQFDRELRNTSHQLRLNKQIAFKTVHLLAGYHFETSDLSLNDERNAFSSVVLQDIGLQRKHHGAVAIAKLGGNTGSDFIQNFHIDFSTRYDRIHDNAKTGASDLQNEWESTVTKFAVEVEGLRSDLAMRFFLNSGSNIKFPTLSQQISNPYRITSQEQQGLEPEKVSSFELGFDISRELYDVEHISGWTMTATYFKNYYNDKFRSYTSPGSPLVFYDNIETAELGGIEGKVRAFFFRKKVTAELGVSKYSIPEKGAFPFKSELKRVMNLTFEHAGYSMLVHHFYESEQTGYIRNYSGRLTEVTLEPFSNLDIHLTKAFNLWKSKLYVNFSARNVIKSKDTILEGLAIRDRRFYITLGGEI